MELTFDKYKRPQVAKMYVATPSKIPICPVSGIQEETVKLKRNVNNTYELSFTVTRFIDIDGQKMVTPSYDYLDLSMRVYVESLGWFILENPVIENDGLIEKKTLTAQSAESEMINHDITSLKINNGTTDSYEMLVEGNVEIIDEVEFAKEQILFYRADKPELSLLDIVLKVSGMYEWSVGVIDTTPKIYKYYENGELKEKSVKLCDEVGYFDIASQNLYAWLTQDAAQFFNCVFEFDFRNFKINAYRPENYGKDTSINIGFRNIQNSNDITIDEENWYTKYYVTGGEDLGIEFVNFGHQWIENIEYFLNTKYLKEELIDKYKLWQEDVEKIRPFYIEETKKYNEQLYVVSELYDRVPLDGCSEDWSKFEDEELTKAEETYEAQLGLLDKIADYLEYHQIKDYILPSINIEWNNRSNFTSEDDLDYIEDYLTDWDLYGLDELQARLDAYQNTVETCTEGGYNKPYSDASLNSESYHNGMYEKYTEAKNQLNASNSGSCKAAYNKRKSEIDSAESVLDGYDKVRKEYAKQTEKENWENGNNFFTQKDLEDLSHCYRYGVYENQNMFLVSTDDAVTAIDEQLKLLSAAQDDLYTYCMPAYTYTTTLENFLSLYEYEDYTRELELGDFVWLGVRDDYVIKLRVMSLEYNPYVNDKEIEIEFSNMLRTRAGRNDVSYLLKSSGGASKNSRSGGNNDYLVNGDIALTPAMINKIKEIASGQIIANGGAGGSADIPIKVLNDKMIQVIDITGENAFFDYMQAKLISADEIVANSGSFNTLEANLATINTLLAGTTASELGQFIRLTANNLIAVDAYAANLIAANITAATLTLSDLLTIASANGGLVMNGEGMQIIGTNKETGEEYVAIQLGYDAQDNPSLIICDGTGAVMLDANGLHEAIVPDQFIKTEMLGDGQVTKAKMEEGFIDSWVDDDGTKVFDVSKFYYGGDKFEVSYTQMTENMDSVLSAVEELQEKVIGIELHGEQIFKESVNGTITPASITVSARCRNGATVGAWYFNGTVNTTFVSEDKSYVVIPPYLVTPDEPLEIKVVDSTGELYDIHTIYYLKEYTGEQGDAAISVVISTETGLVFPDTTKQEETTFVCRVYEGTTEIFPDTYEWKISEDGGISWATVGTDQSLTVPIELGKVKKQIKCFVGFDEETVIEVVLYLDDYGVLISDAGIDIDDYGVVTFSEETTIDDYGIIMA